MSWHHHQRGIECAAIGCRVLLAPSQFMCHGHFQHVTPELRAAIRNARPGDDREDALQDAIEFVGEVPRG